MKKLSLIVLVLVILGVGYYVYAQKNRQAKAPTTDTTRSAPAVGSGQQATNPATTTPPTNNSGGTFSAGTEGDLGVDIQVSEVDFMDSGFSPSSITIKAGDWVLFKNKSTQDFWPASNPHPTHTDYPGFDAKQAIGPGGRYQFQFTKVGSWGYHNHLNPAMGGTIVVTQ